MKFSDGGCRREFNVRFATDTATGFVVGVDVTNAATDSEEMPLMLDQFIQHVRQRIDRLTPERVPIAPRNCKA